MARRAGGAVLAADSENRNGPRTGGAFITCKAGAFTRSPRRRETAGHHHPPAGPGGQGGRGGADPAGGGRAPIHAAPRATPPSRPHAATSPFSRMFVHAADATR